MPSHRATPLNPSAQSSSLNREWTDSYELRELEHPWILSANDVFANVRMYDQQ